MKKLMKKCKKALVIAMTIMLVGTSIDTSTLYVRAENTTDVTDEISEQQTQLDEGEGSGELQNQSGESESGDQQQMQPVENEGNVESFNQPGETEVDYEDLSSLEEGSDESQDQADDDADNGDVQNQPTEGEIIFIDEVIIELPEPGTSVPAMGFFSLADGNVTLASGNHAEWIDRIDLSGDAEIFKTLYVNMEEWSDNDGTDDWMITGEKDQYLVATVSGTVTPAEGQSIEAAVTEKAYAVFDNYSEYVFAVANAFDRDHPEVFWLGGTPVSVPYSYNSTTGDYTMYIYLVFHKTKTVDNVTTVTDIRAVRYRDVNVLKAAITTMNTNANAILAGAEGLDTVGKIKYFNEKLTKINEYNTIISGNGDETLVPRDTWECVSALAGKTGTEGPVCEAYARAFKVLCDRSGIPCILEDGDAGGPHMWNAVQVGGNWYVTDITWNDPTGGASGAVSGYESERWLLLGTNTIPAGETETFSASHVRENSPSGTLQYLNGPVLSTEKYVPYVASVKKGATEEKFESFEAAFNAANAAGEGAVLKLLTSVELEKNYTVTGDFIFDLNGYEAVSGYRIELSANSALTISDNSSTQKGKLCGRGLYFIENEGGILTVTGGTVTNIQGDSNFYYLIENKGTLKVTGGVIENVTRRGYAIYNSAGKVTVEAGKVTNTGENGVAIYNDEGEVTVTGTGTVANTGSYGDAIFNNRGEVTVDGGKVADAGTNGCAIYDNGGKVIVNDGQISSSGEESTTIASVGELIISGGEISNSGTTDCIAIRGNDSVKISNGIVTNCSNKETIIVWGTETNPATLEISGNSTIRNEGTGYAINIHTYDNANITDSVISADDSANFAIYNVGTLTLDGDSTVQGGLETVYNLGSLTINNGMVTGGKNHSIYNSAKGQLLINGGSVENTGATGGGIYNSADASVVITGGTIKSAGSESAIYNYTGSVSISGTPQIVNIGSAPAIAQYGEKLYLSGGTTITGGGTAADIEIRDNSAVGKIVLVGALTNASAYKVGHVDWEENIVTGVFAVGGTNPNDMTAIVYNITAADAAKFVAADTSLLVKQDTTNNQLLLERKPHVHDLYLSNSVNGVASAQTVEILCTNSEDAACELNSNSYYVTVEAPTSLEYDVASKNATVVDNISYNDVEATVSPIAYYVKNGSTWTSVAEVVNVGTYKAEVTVTMGSSSKKAAVEFTIAEKSSEGFVEAIPYSGAYNPFAPDGVDAVEVNLSHPDLIATATIQYSNDGGNTWSTTVPKIKNAGSMSVTVKVTSPNFTKYETTVQATVKPYDISNCSIELEQDTYYYTGKEAKPAVTGLIDGLEQRLPINAADIAVSYENNIAVGTAAVSVSVNSSNYTGTATTVFHIEYYNGDIPILYNGSEDHWAWFAEDVVITAEGYSVKFAEDDTFADSVTVSGEGMVNVKLVFKQDGTGYITEAWDGYVFMDKTGPIFTEEGDGLILVIPSEPSDKEITWNQLATEITYDIYANAYTYARIYASDKYSSVDGLCYYLDTTGSEAALTKAQLDALREAGKFEQLPDGVYSFCLEQDGKFVIYAYVIDGLGNVSEYISSNGIVIDSLAPVVEVVEPTEEAGTLKDTEMTFKVKADEDVMIGVYLTTDYSEESQNMKISNDEYGYWESYPAGEQTEAHEDGKTYISYKVFADANETKTITITGLKPNTYYEYSVEVYDLAQNGTVVAGEEDEMEPGMYWLKEITTLKTVPTFAENPTITGTYGDKLSEMTVSQPVSTNGVAGTWSIVYAGAGQRNDMPAVGGTTAYDVKFTPEDADTYETVTVKVVPDVAKMPLTVKIDNQTRVYGEENSELTYTITEGSIVDSNYAGRPRLNIELSTEAAKTSDAGTYEIIATVTNDDNYAVTVQEGTLTITQADAVITVEAGKDKYNKTFGDDDFNLSGISTNSDGNISYGVIGESVSVSSIGKVVIRGAGSSTITVHVPATKNYKASETVEITITVAKADIDAVNVSKNYLYVNDAQDTIDLSAYVPADAGNVTYSVGAASGECEFVAAPAVDANGKLSYTVKAGEAGESAFFMATVNSDNYKSLVIKVNVALVDKTPVAEKSGSEVSLKNNTLTYGEALSKLEFNEAVFVAEGSGEVVSGTLAWETPDYKPNVATTKATWVFSPDDDKYMSATGELAIVVEKAEQPTLSIEDLGNVEYAPNKELTIITTGGIPDGELTISVPANNGVIELSADGKAKVIGAGTVIITAVNVDPEGNYEDATANYELIVAKAQQPEFSIVPVTDAAYGMEGSVWLETTGGLDGAEITFTVPENNGVVTAVNVSGAGKSFVVPLSSGKVVVTAVAVDPEGNYEDAVATYELTVAPASIKADWISWLDGFTGVGTYNGNEITPGVKVYFIAEGNLTEGEDYTVSYVNNTYAYTLKEGDEGFDATKAPAVVVTGKGNYTGSAKVYFVINKAEAAPNMPKSTKTVASHVATAGQVSLPTDWIWQEPNTALTEGGETIAVAVYNGADKGNYVKETVSVTITRIEAGTPYVSKINGQDVEVIEKGWQNVSDVLNAATEGDVITVEMNGVTVLPGNVIDNIKGKNITVELNMGNGVIWTINGKNITATTVEDVDLKVDLNTTNIPVEVINKITGEISTMQISLAHDGDFGYKAFMRINLDAANAGYYAQLFHYEEASKVLKYMNQSKIDAAGYVELPFTHASEYTIVIDDVAYQVPGSGGNGGGSSAPAATPAPTPAPTQAPPATKLPNTADEFPLEGILLLMMVCMAAFGGTVAYGKCKKAGRK